VARPSEDRRAWFVATRHSGVPFASSEAALAPTEFFATTDTP
jgi:hypothetical protein